MLMLTGRLPYIHFTEHAVCSHMLYRLFCCALSGQLLVPHVNLWTLYQHVVILQAECCTRMAVMLLL